MAIFLYPFYLITFWYKDIPLSLLRSFISFNRYCARLFSFSLLLRTYFKPLKNEYRKGLVLFSIISGMIIKFILLIVLSCIFLIIFCCEFLIFILVVFLPILLLYFLFYEKHQPLLPIL